MFTWAYLSYEDRQTSFLKPYQLSIICFYLEDYVLSDAYIVIDKKILNPDICKLAYHFTPSL